MLGGKLVTLPSSERGLRWARPFRLLRLQYLLLLSGTAVSTAILVHSTEQLYRDSSRACPTLSTSPTAAMQRPQFVLFGDSITQQSFGPGGWGAALADWYSRKADVLLRGFSGYNTRWALFLLDHLFPSGSRTAPTLVTIFFGANDAVLPDGGSAKQHVPIPEYKDNLRAIVERLRSLGTQHIALITPPPISEPHRLKSMQEKYGLNPGTTSPERLNSRTGEYAAACQQLGKDLGIPVLELWVALQQHQGWQDEYLSDGLHLSPAGNQVVYTMLQALIDSSFPALERETLPFDFVEHIDIDGSNPAASFPKALSQA